MRDIIGNVAGTIALLGSVRIAFSVWHIRRGEDAFTEFEYAIFDWLFRTYGRIFGYRYKFKCLRQGCWFEVSSTQKKILEDITKAHFKWHNDTVLGVPNNQPAGPLLKKKRPCDIHKSGAVCTAEGCFGESCLEN